MFDRSRRNIARWLTLSMGSILVIFAGAIYYQRVADRLTQSDQLLYSKARVMAANIEYETRSQAEQIDLSHVPYLGQYSPPLDSSLAYARWYTLSGQLRQFHGPQPSGPLVATNAFETVQLETVELEQAGTGAETGSIRLRQLTLPVTAGERTIGYLQIAMPLSQTETDLRNFLRVLVLAVPLGLGLISLTSWLLGGLAMRPIQQAYRQLQRFTADASHELRAPLAAVLSNAQVGLLAPLSQGEAKHKRLENIADLTKGMNVLVGNLLFLARRAGHLSPDSIKPVNLNQLLEEVVGLPTVQEASARIKLQLALPDETIVVEGNLELLHQAVLNLVTNACKYTIDGGLVWVRLVGLYHCNLIQVEDTGIGIPAADLPHVFERFYRVDQERTRDRGGSGLGLAIAQQIVEAHGGRLTATSQLGKGSLFQIELPL